MSSADELEHSGLQRISALISLWAFLKGKRKGILFVFSRFMEQAGIFLSISLCGSRIGPAEMGTSIPVFLYITYSSFLGVGGCLVLYKKYLIVNQEMRRRLCNVVYRWYLLAAFAGLFLAFVFLDRRYALLTGIIVLFTLCKSYLETICRLQQKILFVSISDLLFASIALLGCYSFVSSFYDYLLVFAISKIAALSIYLILQHSFVFERLQDLFRNAVALRYYAYVLLLGAQLASITFCTTLLMTCDKFFVARQLFDKQEQGVYQMADTITKISPFFINVFAVFYFPEIVKKLKLSSAMVSAYFRNMCRLFLIVPAMTVCFVIGTAIVQPRFFSAYPALPLYTGLLCFGKSCASFFLLFGYIMISQNKERKLLLYLVCCVCFLCGCYSVIAVLRSPLLYYALSVSVLIPVLLTAFCLSLRGLMKRAGCP